MYKKPEYRSKVLPVRFNEISSSYMVMYVALGGHLLGWSVRSCRALRGFFEQNLYHKGSGSILSLLLRASCLFSQSLLEVLSFLRQRQSWISPVSPGSS